MTSNDLKDLFQQSPAPQPDEQAQKAAVNLAVQAFKEEAQSQTVHKTAKKRQGFWQWLRPNQDINPKRDEEMKNRQPIWLGALATSCILVIGVLMSRQMPTDERPTEFVPVSDGPATAAKVQPPSDIALLERETGATVDDLMVRPPQTAKPQKQDTLSPQKQDALPAQQEARAHKHVIATPDTRPNTPIAKSSAEQELAIEEVVVTGIKAASPQPLKMAKKLEAQALSKMKPNSVVLNDLAVSPPPQSRDRFESTDENPVKLTQDSPVSTFSIDVDTASYSFVRRQLNAGKLPATNAVRTEEMINYFDYDYPTPESKTMPFKPTISVLDAPWKEGNKLVHIGIKGYELPKSQQPNSNLVFLLDVSGSMNHPDKLPLVKQSMSLLLDTLKPSDTVAMVVYAGAAGTVLEPTKVARKQTILNALNRLQAGGATAGAQGIRLAYQLAEAHYQKNAVNRVVLATDGDFNVGITQDERLEDFVSRKRESGIYLSVLGFGQGNYQDALMQTLAQNGNGVAAYIDTLSEAQKVLVNEATSALFPIATDVKIQVEFNPAAVSEYRLIGYETRALNREDFNNDKVDAGDIGAGHKVTAIYEITPTGSRTGLMPKLRYGQDSVKPTPLNQEYGFLKIRYKLPGEATSKLISHPITTDLNLRRLNATHQREVAFSCAVAGFAQRLKNSKYIDNFSYDQIIDLAQRNKGEDEYGYRTEFIQLVRKAKIAKAL